MSLEILREIAAGAGGVAPGGLPPGELRFVIEMAGTPDLKALRVQVRALLGADSPEVEALFPDEAAPLDRFVLLRIVGASRTFPLDVLFEMSYALADALGAVSVEPDTGARVFEEADPGSAPAGAVVEAAIVRAWCNVDDEPPANRRWALENIRAPEAWALSPKQGAGVIVAQPDTGVVAVHDELEPGAIDLTRAGNMLEAGKPPIDPLKPGMANPGHGTATASCVVSRSAGTVNGSAPAAQVAPIRCIDDVKVFDASPVARAINHARQQGCHVITMSLGGLPSRALRTALRAAVDAQMIVLAAAGNCVRFVVWPAKYGECIAVAGTNFDDKPWKGSSRGSAVDVSAPAENVWKANANSPTQVVTHGQGTSFAVALTAGAAALWIAHHGHATLVAEADRRGVKVQDLFRAALRQSARVPAGWDKSDFGAGIVDAGALLALPLAAIPAAQREAAGDLEGRDIRELLVETSAPLPMPPADFDWEKYGLELASVAAESARRTRRADGGAATETGLQGYRPSRTLLEQLDAPQGIRELAMAPPPRVAIVAASAATRGMLGTMGRRSLGSGHESAGSLTPQVAAESVGRSRDKLVNDAIEQVRAAAKPGQEELVDFVRTEAPAALDRLARGEDLESMPVESRTALEALVVLDGSRPALRVQDDSIDFDDPRLGKWLDKLVLFKDFIPKFTRSVGRVEVGNVHVGTGWVIAPNLVMTNRHVLEVIASPQPQPLNPQRWTLLYPDAAIDFKREAGSDEKLRFRIEAVVFAGPSPTNDTAEVDFTDLDVAVLRIAPQSTDGKPQPAPLAIQKTPVAETELLVIGFPAQPAELPRKNGKIREDIVKLLNEMYGLDYGVKYLSPGRVIELPGQVSGDPRKWAFSHDAATLGGNSGSCVVRYGANPAVVGLHFAGAWEKSNNAHAMNELVNGNHLPTSLTGLFKLVQGPD